MTNARLKEGPCAPLFYWALVLLLGGQAFAQTVEVADLARCGELPTPTEKLACFEAIVAEAQGAAVAAAPAVAAASTPDLVEAAPAATAEAAMPAVAGETGAQAEIVVAGETPVSEPVAADPVVATSPVNEVPAEITAAPVAATAAAAVTTGASAPTTSVAAAPVAAEPVATADAPAMSAEAADEFGRDHLEEEDSFEPQVLHATVTEVTKSSRGSLIFNLDNGQVWRQTEPRFYPYPRGRPFDIEIEEGLLGKYSLQVEGEGRKVAVRRTK